MKKTKGHENLKLRDNHRQSQRLISGRSSSRPSISRLYRVSPLVSPFPYNLLQIQLVQNPKLRRYGGFEQGQARQRLWI